MKKLPKWLQVSLTLSLIGGVAALLISSVNLLTSPIIESAQKENAEKKLKEVYPEATSFGEAQKLDGYTYVVQVTQAFQGENTLGYIYEANGQNNYGVISLLVGFNDEGRGRVVLLENGQSYGQVLEDNYLGPLNDGEIGLDEVNCGATYGASLIRDMVEEAATIYEQQFEE